MTAEKVKQACGIYEILNTTNGKRYIGSSIKTRQRCIEHRRNLRNGRHHSRHLQRAWNKYGEDSFRFSVIEECTESELIVREQFYIDLLADYNSSPTAGNCLGVRHSLETKNKHSYRMKKMIAEKPEFLDHMMAMSKMPKPDHWKKGMSERMKGVPKSQEQKLNMSVARAEMNSEQVLKACDMRKGGMTVKQIAKELSIGFGAMQRLFCGKSYRWVDGIPSVEALKSMKKTPSRDGCAAIYNFSHPDVGVFSGTRKEFRSSFPSYHPACINSLCNGRSKTHRGWTVSNPSKA